MVNEGCDLRYHYPIELDAHLVTEIYKAMCNAAPVVEQEPVNLRAQADMIWRDDDSVAPVSEFKRWLSVLAPLYRKQA
jgi:hypothetical protein